MREIEFGPQGGERSAAVYVGAVDERWILREGNCVEPRQRLGAVSNRASGTARPVSQFVGVRYRAHDRFVCWGASLVVGAPNVFRVELHLPSEDFPVSWASELASLASVRSASSSAAALLRFDRSSFHPVDGRLREHRCATAVIVELLAYDLADLDDASIADMASRSWRSLDGDE